MKFVANSKRGGILDYCNKDFEKKGFKFVGIGEMLKQFCFHSNCYCYFMGFSHWMIENTSLLINILLMGSSLFVSMALAVPFNRETKIVRYYDKLKNRLNNKEK